MKHHHVFLFALFIFLIGFQSCKKSPEIPKEEKIETPEDAVFVFKKNLYQNEIDSVFKKYDFNGSIAVFQDSVLLARKDLGMEDFSSKKPIDEHSVFAIGSISKQFTAAMIFRLEEQQKLNTEDPVAHFLPEFQTSEKKTITIQQLLNHTSGINDFGDGLKSKPGTEFEYSNKGYRFLGEIIEKASGKSFDENAKELFAKAGLQNTSTPSTFSGNHFANCYTGTKKQFHKVENMPKRLENKSISVAAGGILSTVNDLHRWNQNLYSGKILNPSSMQKLLSKSKDRQHPIFGKMGYGSGIMMTPGSSVLYFHSGYVKGSPSLNVYYPETKVSLIVLSNIANESIGKNAFFAPHLALKKCMMQIETSAASTEKMMRNSIEN